MRRRVLVTGASGRLAGALSREFGADSDVIALARADLDITDDGAARVAVAAARPDLVLNCASYNDVDGAEGDPLRALEVNAFGVRALARAAGAAGAALVHYSTDFVFDGTASRPYTEDDQPNPQGVYAASKLLGEWFALEADRGAVLRVESLFGGDRAGSGRTGSVEGIVSGLEAGREVPVFVDRTVSPSYVVDVARATRALVDSRAAGGIYHCVNAGACRWSELATEAARLLGRPANLKPITLASASLRAHRPVYCALDTARLRAAGIDMPPWQDALARYLRERAPVRA